MQVIYDPAQQLVPIKAWLADLDQGTLEQARNLARLPFAVPHVALMPDAHHGYGMPIGGVLPARGYVVPNAIGVDIGCGMHARRTNIEAGRLSAAHKGQRTVLRAVLNTIQRAVPTGNGPVGNHPAPQSWEEPLSDPAIAALIDGAPADLRQAWQQSGYQIGTLGGGERLAPPA